MARRMEQEQGAYRAVVTVTWPSSDEHPEGRTSTWHWGPYDRLSTAAGVVTQKMGWAEKRGRKEDPPPRAIEGHIEQATAWEKVPA